MGFLFIIGRILFGGYFLYNGYNHFAGLAGMTGYAASKGVPYPKFMVMLSGAVIFLGGLGIILGVYPQVSLALIALFLVFVTPAMHNYWKEADPMAKMGSRINFQKNVALLGAALVMLAALPSVWPLSF